MTSNYFAFKAARATRRAEIYIYGAIGDDWFGEGISAKRFRRELKDLGDPKSIDLHIDSFGGSVFDARTIYTLLTEHKAKIDVSIDGTAASAASFIAMAGDSIKIAEGGFFMIHEASGFTYGDAAKHEKTASLLRTVNGTILNTYASRTKLEEQKLADWMAEETWFTGSEAVAAGFADEVIADKRVAASAPNAVVAAYKRLPKELQTSKVVRTKVHELLEGLR